MSHVIDLSHRQTLFKDKIQEIMPQKGNLDMCLTCGTCVNGCPASGLADMDPRKFLRMVLLGMDKEVLNTPWVWMCTMCQRCKYACPMEIDIGSLVSMVRQHWHDEGKTPKGIHKSCQFNIERGSSAGISKDDWLFIVDDTLEEFHEKEPEWRNVQAHIDKKGAQYYLNQNAREPVTEPEEMIPLWKIFHQVGIDWTYSSEYWDATNYCMFAGSSKDWEYVLRKQVELVNDLGCKYFINTD